MNCCKKQTCSTLVNYEERTIREHGFRLIYGNLFCFKTINTPRIKLLIQLNSQIRKSNM